MESCAFTIALSSSSSLATLTLPHDAAKWRGVQPQVGERTREAKSSQNGLLFGMARAPLLLPALSAVLPAFGR